MKNHTKGKWQFNGRDIIVGQNIGQQRICTLVEHRDKYKAEDEANAKLIAAAPSMLDALHLAWGGLSTEPDVFAEHLRIVDEAIELAT